MYSFNSTVRYTECSLDGNLSVPALINYLQDCSIFHTESLGHGMQYGSQRHFAWFIAAWQIHIRSMPRFMQSIKVSTWCHSMKPMLAARNFLIQDADGAHLVEADSLWFPFDTQRNRPIRIPKEEMVYLTDDPPLNLPPTRRKLFVEGEGIACETISVAPHHIDTNQHVNNGQYVAMADEVIRTHRGSFLPKVISVQYKQAAHLGDVIMPTLYDEQAGFAVDLASEEGTSFAIVRMASA